MGVIDLEVPLLRVTPIGRMNELSPVTYYCRLKYENSWWYWTVLLRQMIQWNFIIAMVLGSSHGLIIGYSSWVQSQTDDKVEYIIVFWWRLRWERRTSGSLFDNSVIDLRKEV